MNNENETKKEADQKDAYGYSTGATAGCDIGKLNPMVETGSLQSRLRCNLARATQWAEQADAIRELLYLLDKNPEVGRILDLVQLLGAPYDIPQ